jgi:adenylyltransferase/sulfurtransferase
VLIIGAGGLGSPVALTLARAGPVTLGLVDDDAVDLSNLHRQLLHGEADLGRPKVESGRDALLRHGADVVPIAARLGPENAREILAGWQVVVDGSDSIATKFLVSDTAVRLGLPAVIGGVVRWSGQLLTVLPGETACYRCLFEAPPAEAPPSCQEAGVLGPACGLIGALQAAEVRRLLAGQRPRYAGAVLVADLLSLRLRRVAIHRRTGCEACKLRVAQ